MFVMTEENEMVNLGNWEGVKIKEAYGKYVILAFNDYVIDQQSRDIILVSFDKQEDAEKAYDDLFDALLSGKTAFRIAQKHRSGQPMRPMSGQPMTGKD